MRLSELIAAVASGVVRLETPALVSESPVLLAANATWEYTREQRARGVASNRDPLVYLLVKAGRPDNPFASGVTVGRIDHNDIPIDDASISRFHAWFQREERSGVWSITDAESKNGTFLDERRLVASQKSPVHDGALIRFGDVEVRFVLPETLRSILDGAH